MTRKILLTLVCGMVMVASVAGYMPAWGVTVSGTVTDTEGQAVVGARVEFEVGIREIFYSITDQAGRYEIDLPAQSTEVVEGNTGTAPPRKFFLAQSYPNPFNPSTRIPYVTSARTSLTLFCATTSLTNGI